MTVWNSSSLIEKSARERGNVRAGVGYPCLLSLHTGVRKRRCIATRGEVNRGRSRSTHGAPPAPLTAWTPAFIVLTEELHLNYLLFLGVAIADSPRVRGTSPRDIGRHQLQVGTRCPLSSRKGEGVIP